MNMKKVAKAPPKPLPKSDLDEASLLTVKEVATLDRCSEKTVRRAIDAGLLQAIRIGPGGRLLRVTRVAHQTYRLGLRL